MFQEFWVFEQDEQERISSMIRQASGRFSLYWLPPLVVTIVFILLNGCGTTSSMQPGMPGSTSSFAFISNSGSGNVSAFAVSTTGGLTPVSGSPFAAGAGAEFMALDSMHKFLFVANQS